MALVDAAVASGLLAGVFRRHLLELRPEIEERVLFLYDLRQADGVYIANSVRACGASPLSGNRSRPAALGSYSSRIRPEVVQR